MSNDTYKSDVGAAINGVAKALHALGVGNAATDMGAIESHSLVMKDAIREHGSVISDALTEVASALFDVADAIRESREVE